MVVEAHPGGAGELDPANESPGRQVEDGHRSALLDLDRACLGDHEVDRRAGELALARPLHDGDVDRLDRALARGVDLAAVGGHRERQRRARRQHAARAGAGREIDDRDRPSRGDERARPVRRRGYGARAAGQCDAAGHAVVARVEQHRVGRVGRDDHHPRLRDGGDQEEQGESGQERSHETG
jgi:hypothetical protein